MISINIEVIIKSRYFDKGTYNFTIGQILSIKLKN